MIALAPLTLSRFVTTWRFDPWVVGSTAVALIAYAYAVRAAKRRGVRQHALYFQQHRPDHAKSYHDARRRRYAPEAGARA